MTVDFADLQLGVPYQVEFSDCCVQGSFYAGPFLGYENERDVAVFQFGRCETEWGNWTFKVGAP